MKIIVTTLLAFLNVIIIKYANNDRGVVLASVFGIITMIAIYLMWR